MQPAEGVRVLVTGLSHEHEDGRGEGRGPQQLLSQEEELDRPPGEGGRIQRGQ